jgi:hypothetical protein
MSVTYKNNGGTHVMVDGTVIKAGQVFACDDENLDKIFVGKFSKVIIETPAKAAAPAQKAQEPTKVAKPAPAPATAASGNGSGEDVTDQFPRAAGADLTVRRTKSGHWVYDGATDPANDAPLTKKGVEAFLTEYLKDD